MSVQISHINIEIYMYCSHRFVEANNDSVLKQET